MEVFLTTLRRELLLITFCAIHVVELEHEFENNRNVQYRLLSFNSISSHL